MSHPLSQLWKIYLPFWLVGVCSACQLSFEGLSSPIDCSLGTFGKFIESSSKFVLSQATDSGCILLQLLNHFEYTFEPQAPQNLNHRKDEKGTNSGLLLARGGCSFYTKAQYAHALGFDVVVLSDYDIAQGGSEDGLVPTIAEFGHEVATNITVIGISSIDANTILSRHSNTSIDDLTVELSSSSSFSQYVSRTEALLNSGFNMLAAGAMNQFLDHVETVHPQLSASQITYIIKQLMSLSRRFSEIGMELSVSMRMMEVAVSLDKSCIECLEQYGQLSMKSGRVKESLDIFHRIGTYTDGGDIESELIQSIRKGRLAALTFLVGPEPTTDLTSEPTHTSLVSLLQSALSWREAKETFRSIPMGERQRHRTLYDGIVNSGGVGDSTLWLLFTLIDEVSRSSWLNVMSEDGKIETLSIFLSSETGTCLSGIYERQELDVLADSAEIRDQCCGYPSSYAEKKTISIQQHLEALMDIHLTLSLFLDETGLFELSKRHLIIAISLAERSCSHNAAVGLQLRLAAMTPTVFSSHEDVSPFQQHRFIHIESLLKKLNFQNQSKHFDNMKVFDPSLRYTITPASMMVGYQSIPATGMDACSSLTRDTRALRQLHRITSTFQVNTHQTSYISSSPPVKNMNSSTERNVINVGFISSYLRTHSVGRLIAGVIAGVNSNRNVNLTNSTNTADIKCHVFIANHFLPVDKKGDKFEDPIVNSLVEALNGRVHILPKSKQVGQVSLEALEMLSKAKLDILVYPELGMDAVMLLYASFRLAPVQCVFWGHPISQGLSSIDYFITSDLFEEDAHLELVSGESQTSSLHSNVGNNLPNKKGNCLWRQDTYHEQSIRLEGLTAYFSKPELPSSLSQSTTLMEMGLPTDARIYLIPQTLMKFHPQFDRALVSILMYDPHAVIIITYNTNQATYKAVLEKRICTLYQQSSESKGTSAGICRVLFIGALEHEAYLGLLQSASVMLDPYPFGGGVTTLEALAVGTPVVTLPRMQSVVQLAAGFYRRMSKVSIFSSEKLKEVQFPIATNPEDFVRQAISIASSSEIRDNLKQKIFESQHVLYEDEEVNSEWKKLFRRIARR